MVIWGMLYCLRMRLMCKDQEFHFLTFENLELTSLFFWSDKPLGFLKQISKQARKKEENKICKEGTSFPRPGKFWLFMSDCGNRFSNLCLPPGERGSSREVSSKLQPSLGFHDPCAALPRALWPSQTPHTSWDWALTLPQPTQRLNNPWPGAGILHSEAPDRRYQTCPGVIPKQ